MADLPPEDRNELVGELRDRVRSLERRLDEERESRRRADNIIAQLTQATAALTERSCKCASGPPADHGAEVEPSVLRGAIAEAANELARRIVGLVISNFLAVPSWVLAVISFFNANLVLGFIGLAVAVVSTLVGLYHGIKASRAAQIGAEILAQAPVGDASPEDPT